jgi:DNA-binding SARP family transcriptional activator
LTTAHSPQPPLPGLGSTPDLRIRILGDLEVWRRDGTNVGHDEWRTGKTRDLLRILALNNGRRTRVAGVLDKLWPDVSPDRARASLRTACSQIRRATDLNCVVRQDYHLVLQGAWVDAILFLDDARRVHAAAEAGRHVRALDLTRAAERHYRGDFQADNDEGSWATAEREHLAQCRRGMLSDASEAAIALGRLRDAVDLARTAVQIDRSSEGAHRALMRAHAGQGDLGSALRAFEDCRSYLAAELGVDPSPQTQALHLRLLRGEYADDAESA